MNENNHQQKAMTKEKLKMFYMTKKGRKLKRFKTIHKVSTVLLSIIMAVAILAEIALGAGIAVLGTRISGAGDDTQS